MAVWQKICLGIAALVAPLCFLADTSIADTLPFSEASSEVSELQMVPPDGLDSLNPNELQYFQDMGPLEYATRLSGVPATPAWRIRLRLYPQDTGAPDGLTYAVKVDHYNLSPALYQEVAHSYGVENTDPSLDNRADHQHLAMIFMPIMGVSAHLLPESVQLTQSAVESNPACGPELGCAVLRYDDDGEWEAERFIQLEAAPWETAMEPAYAMVRALAQQSGWLQVNGIREQWSPPEVPEGIREEHPWVEILIENYIGNGGVYLAEWTERVADDSVSSVVHRVYYHSGAGAEAWATQSSICARGEDAGKIRSLCP
ncbi:MAG: hypothetical protein AAGE59_23065 [Cyanobacteria bacterium P01_F01_bin.86]